MLTENMDAVTLPTKTYIDAPPIEPALASVVNLSFIIIIIIAVTFFTINLIKHWKKKAYIKNLVYVSIVNGLVSSLLVTIIATIAYRLTDHLSIYTVVGFGNFLAAPLTMSFVSNIKKNKIPLITDLAAIYPFYIILMIIFYNLMLNYIGSLPQQFIQRSL